MPSYLANSLREATGKALADQSRSFFGELSRQASMFFLASCTAMVRWEGDDALGPEVVGALRYIRLAQGVGVLHQLTQEGLPHLKDIKYLWYPMSRRDLHAAVWGTGTRGGFPKSSMYREGKTEAQYFKILLGRGTVARLFSLPLYVKPRHGGFSDEDVNDLQDLGWMPGSANPSSLPRALEKLLSDPLVRGTAYWEAATAYGVPDPVAQAAADAIDALGGKRLSVVLGLEKLSRLDAEWGVFGPPELWADRHGRISDFGQLIARERLNGGQALLKLRSLVSEQGDRVVDSDDEPSP